MNYDTYVFNEYARLHIYTLNGLYHRTDGPALLSEDCLTELWFYNGVKHRENGPAEIYLDNYGIWNKNYWFHGKRINSEEELKQLVRLKSFI